MFGFHYRCVKLRDVPKVAEDAGFHFLYAFLPRRGELILPVGYSSFAAYYDAVKDTLDFTTMPHLHFVNGVKNALEKFEAMKCQDVDEFLKFLETAAPVNLTGIELDFELMQQVVGDICRDADRRAVFQDSTVMPNDPYFSNEEFRGRIKAMNKQQLLVFRSVFENINRDKQLLLFVTGGGGTGKSFLIQNIRELFVRRNSQETTILLCAPTGIYEFLYSKFLRVLIHYLFRCGIAQYRREDVAFHIQAQCAEE